MSGYSRQQSYTGGDVILAEHTNDEFDLLEEVFSTSLGHKHDGTVAEGATIDLISDDDADTFIKVEVTADDDTIHLTSAGTEQLTIDPTNITATGNVIFNGTVDINSGAIDATTIGSTTPSTGDFTTTTADSLQLNGGTGTDGTFSWNATDATVDLDLLNGVVLQLGQEIHLYARNNTGSSILNGQVVRVTGSSGNRPTIALATNATEIGSDNTIAVATQTIANNSNGYVTAFGLVRDIDTSTLTEGSIVYLGVDGALTTTAPVPPAFIVKIGWCVVSHAVNGVIFVSVDRISDIDRLSNVSLTSTADNDFLSYDSASSTWKNTKEAHFTSGAIDGVTVGATTPSTGAFTSVNIDGGTIDSTTITTSTMTGNTISGGTIDSTPIGATTPSTGAFTTISATDTTGFNSDLLDSQHGAYYLDWTNTTNKPDPTLTLDGDVSGSATFTDLGNATLTVTVADDSHNHLIANVDGLQTELDTRVPQDSTTGAASLPTGTTAQRPGSPAEGMFRRNTTTGSFEGYDGTAWTGVGGASGGAGNPFVYEHDHTVTQDYTIAGTNNAVSAGPLTISDGVTITVSSGATWTVV